MVTDTAVKRMVLATTIKIHHQDFIEVVPKVGVEGIVV